MASTLPVPPQTQTQQPTNAPLSRDEQRLLNLKKAREALLNKRKRLREEESETAALNSALNPQDDPFPDRDASSHYQSILDKLDSLTTTKRREDAESTPKDEEPPKKRHRGNPASRSAVDDSDDEPSLWDRLSSHATNITHMAASSFLVAGVVIFIKAIPTLLTMGGGRSEEDAKKKQLEQQWNNSTGGVDALPIVNEY